MTKEKFTEQINYGKHITYYNTEKVHKIGIVSVLSSRAMLCERNQPTVVYGQVRPWPPSRRTPLSLEDLDALMVHLW
jgi:hypothetical protein